MKTIICSILFFLSVSEIVFAQPELIREVPLPTLKLNDKQDKAVKLLSREKKYKKMNFVNVGKLADVQEAGSFYVNVPGKNKPYRVKPKLVEGDIATSYGMMGSLTDSIGQVILTSRNGILRGYVDLGADKYELVHIGDDLYAWLTLEPKAASCSATYAPLPTPVDKPRHSGARQEACSYNPVRILIAYTQSAANQTSDINGLVDQAIWSFRAALSNSAAYYYPPQFVVIGQTGWNESFGANPQDPGRQNNDANNFADFIASERNRTNADICICITGNDYTNFDGIAQNVVVDANNNYACLIEANSVINGFGFSHELGHLFGLQHHDCDQSPNGELTSNGTILRNRGCVPYDPSAGFHGFRFERDRNRWHTIMHYDYFEQAGGGLFDPLYIKHFIPINHFSDPNIQYDGRPTGDAGHRNAWVLRGNSSVIASHRPGNGVVNGYIEAPTQVAYYQNFVAEVVYSCADNYSFEWRVSRDGGLTYSGVLSQSDLYNTSIYPEQPAIILQCRINATGGSTVVYHIVEGVSGDPTPARKAAEAVSDTDNYLLSVSPNPAPSDVTVSFTLPEAQSAQISVVNALGTPVHTLALEKVGAGTHTRTLILKKLPAGLYVVQLATPLRTLSKKIIITH